MNKLPRPSLLTKIYRLSAHIPPLRSLINFLIRKQIPVSINIGEGTIILDQSDVAVSGSLAMGKFENQEIDLFRKALKPGMVVVDVGANIGLYSVIASKAVGKSGQVFSFEPVSEIHSHLKKNILRNDINNITPLDIALDSKPGQRSIYLAKDNKGHNSFGNDHLSYKTSIIKTDTLDNILEKFGSPKVDIIKMDIEGAEPLAFEGMTKTLQRSPNVTIFTEYFPTAIRRVGRDPFQFLSRLMALNKKIHIIFENKKNYCEILDSNDIEYLTNYLEKNNGFTNFYITD